MVVTDPKFIETLQTITGQAGKAGAPVLQADFGATDPVGLVHAQAKADELEDLLKGMRGGPDDDVLSGGRQRRNGKRQEGALDLLASRSLNDIMNDIMMQQTMDMMDRIIELGREIDILDRRIDEFDRRIEAFDNKYLTEEQRTVMDAMETEAEKEAYRLEQARRNGAPQHELDLIARIIELRRLTKEERRRLKEELAEFMDEHIDQIREAAFQYEALIQKREELSTKIAQNDALSTRLDELRAEGENERTTQELDGIIRTRSDLEIRLSGDETYDERIDAVDAAVEQQTIKLTHDLGEVGTAIQKIEDAEDVLTVNSLEQNILQVEEKGNVVIVEQEANDILAGLGLKDGFQSAHNDEQSTTTTDTNEVDPADVKIAEAKPISFGSDIG